jgi:hypothetical protein
MGLIGGVVGTATMEPKLGFDRASVRSVDEFGRLHVATSNVAMASVSPYFGFEIIGWKEHGLDPNETYMLLRDPEELKKAVESFNNQPIMDLHPKKAQTPQNPQKDKIIGSTGTNAEFHYPFVTNSLVFWDASAIEGIQTRMQVELSPGYLYDLDMTPGTFEGVKYDFVMRNIRVNHEGLVPEGRQGPQVVVSDAAMATDVIRHMPGHKDSDGKPAEWVIKSEKDGSILWSGGSEAEAKKALGRIHSYAKDARAALRPGHQAKPANSKGGPMAKDRKLSPQAVAAKGALMAFLRPKLATDAQPSLISDLNGILKGVTAKKYAAQQAGIAGNIKQVFTPKLAKDGDLDLGEVADLLSALNGAMNGGEPDEDDMATLGDDEDDLIQGGEGSGEAGMGGDGPDDCAEQIMSLLDGQGVPPEILQQIAALCDKMQTPAKPAVPAKPKLNPKEGQMPNTQAPAPGIQKPAMDEAIKLAADAAIADTVKRMNAIRLAEKEVQPFIGEVVAQDSANAVYKLALDAAKVDLTGADESSYPFVFRAWASQQSKAEPAPLAQDSAANAETLKRFPQLAKIGHSF